MLRPCQTPFRYEKNAILNWALGGVIFPNCSDLKNCWYLKKLSTRSSNKPRRVFGSRVEKKCAKTYGLT